MRVLNYTKFNSDQYFTHENSVNGSRLAREKMYMVHVYTG